MMVERVGIIDEDEELEMLLGEIPHATSLSLHHHHHHPSYSNGHHHHHHHHHHHNHHHHHHCVNGNHHGNASILLPPVNRMVYGMYDDDHDSYGHSSSHEPIPKPYSISRNPYSELPQLSFGKEVDENFIDEFGRMYISQSNSFGDSDYLVANPHFSRIPMSSENLLSQSNMYRSVLNYCHQPRVPARIGMNSMDEMMQNVPYNHDPYRLHMAAGGSSNIRINHGGLGLGLGYGSGVKGLATCEDSLIIQGEDVSRVRKKFMRPCENGQTKVDLFSSHLTQARQYIYAMAKDQHGCRLLQRVFDDGDPQHVQVVFDEIIGCVVELMINPFGNYLMQKLLDVCNDEQRMCILTAITREPGDLVQISLNTHGTRVVQKLIETIKTRQQVKLVVSAIEPGFLALIKDLNGNHVIQRCLQRLSNEDNKFIFEAAAKFCVEIATHQHGCCVLQRCINHSTDEYREKLVSEISRNGLILAQDAFGNYVVQYILELQIPSAVSKLTSQFKGNYVHLATQKFSSHVVEKCLAVLDGQIRSTIIRELISAAHFEQLLQDPHANYVVQTALRVAEGPLHKSLVNVIESHKAISRNNPYSKRIFSHKLLKM